MIRRENPNFVASLYAPNPKEVTYWIDLNESPDGLIIKTFVNNTWVKVNQDENDNLSLLIQQLLENKADKATTLSGYGITDAYTKGEVNSLVSAKANSADVYTKTLTDNLIDTKVAALVSQAPETLDTLDELAAALGDDPNFATTVANLIGTKLSTSTYNADKATFITSDTVDSVAVVDALPGTQQNNVLYIVITL